MYHEPKSWNEPLIDAMFSQEVANAIKSIPLVVQYLDDTISWFLDTKGQFSVKSGYKVAWGPKVKSRLIANS